MTYLYEQRSDAILLKRFGPVSERKEESSWGKNVMVMIDLGKELLGMKRLLIVIHFLIKATPAQTHCRIYFSAAQKSVCE